MTNPPQGPYGPPPQGPYGPEGRPPQGPTPPPTRQLGPPGQGYASKPGLYVVLALVLIVGGCLAISSTGSDEPTSNTGGASAPTAAPYSGGTPYVPPAVPAPSVSLPPPVPKYEQTWTGRIRITDQGTNIGRQPPQPDSSGYQVKWYGYLYSISNTIGTWNDPTTTPTYEQCKAAQLERNLSSRERNHINFVKGRGYCMSANDRDSGHATVFLRFVSIDGEGVLMDGIRWADQG